MKKNFFRFYSRFTSISVVLILFILTSTVIPQNKINKNISEGDAFQISSMTGDNPGDRFGASVKTAGDVNGDGYDDFIIGAFYNDGTETDAGSVYIYFGGINVNTIPDVILTGYNAGDALGYSVSTAGDLNGDGFSDVIVSAIGYSGSSGRVYIFFGGENMDSSPDIILDSETPAGYFGYSVSTAGDVNADGYSDVVVSAFLYGNKRGRAYIYFGGLSMNNVADVIMTGEGDYDEFGISVSNAGDVNGDGFSDVIIGADQYDLYGTGKAYVFLGGVSMDNVPDAVMSGGGAGDQFGRFSSGAGDVNGDGYADVIVGMNGFNNGRDYAYVYFGGPAIDNAADVTFSEPSDLIFGFGVSTAGDINGDGFSDVMVTAWIYDNVSNVYIYYGGSDMNNVSDTILYGEGTNDRFGLALSTAGDVNDDGYSDLIIGAPEYNNYTGKAFLFMSDVFTITASAGPNGSINPSGNVYLMQGENQIFTMIPDQGYQISDVLIDGISAGAVESYTFTNVIANHTIYASFDLIPPAEQVQLIGVQVNDYITSGILSSGVGNALTVKLNEAVNQINNNHIIPAINRLNAFINQVEALIRTGRLNSEQGFALIDPAVFVIEQLNGDGNKLQTEIPKEYNLSQNYPNPFNPVTNIDFDLPFDSKLTITIYDITGREVKTLLNEVLPAGYHTIEFNAGSMASGIYFCRMAAEGNGEQFVMTKKMTVIK